MSDILLYLSKNRAVSTFSLGKAASACGAMHARGFAYLAARCGVFRGACTISSLLASLACKRAWRCCQIICLPFSPFFRPNALTFSRVTIAAAYRLSRSGRISASAAITGSLTAAQWPDGIRAICCAMDSSNPSRTAPPAQKWHAMDITARCTDPAANCMRLACNTTSIGIGSGFNLAMPQITAESLALQLFSEKCVFHRNCV